MPRQSPDDCMFCAMGDCSSHAPRQRAPRKLVNPSVPKPAKAEAVPVKPSRAAIAMQTSSQENDEYERELAAALQVLAPILHESELIKHRQLIGPIADTVLRKRRWVADWKRRCQQ
jgi:hypothetical protein